MSHSAPAGIMIDHNTFDEYCVRHRVKPETAIAELVSMALSLPADILDYLREQRGISGAAA